MSVRVAMNGSIKNVSKNWRYRPRHKMQFFSTTSPFSQNIHGKELPRPPNYCKHKGCDTGSACVFSLQIVWISKKDVGREGTPLLSFWRRCFRNTFGYLHIVPNLRTYEAPCSSSYTFLDFLGEWISSRHLRNLGETAEHSFSYINGIYWTILCI